MASIQSLGVGSGLLTSKLVEDIISSERKATDLRLETRKATVEAKISSYAAIRSAVSTVSTAVAALSSSNSLLVNTTASSVPTSVTAIATATAETGVHTLDVTTLARKQTLATKRYDGIESVVGDGVLNIKFGTTTLGVGGAYQSFVENTDRAAFSITIPPERKTLAGIRDAINESGRGITASIVQDGQGHVLVLAADSAGVDNTMEISVTEGVTAGLSALSYKLGAATPGTHLTQTVAGQDAVLTVDGITISRQTNVISDVIPGVTFNLLSATASTASISISRDDSEINKRVQSFVEGFNTLKGVVDELTRFDEKEKTGSLLIGDSTLRGLKTQMRRVLGSGINGLDSTSVRALVDIGIRTDQDASFALTFNSSKFASALSSNPTGVRDLLTDSTKAADTQIKVTSFQRSTAAGNYAVNVNQLASQGLLTGTATPGLDSPITVDADSDNLTFKIDGISAAVTLTHGIYTSGSTLASEIQKQINSIPALKNVGLGVTATYDTATDRLKLTSNTFGSNSQVAITVVDTDTLAKFGFAVADGAATKGVDTAGTINGIKGSGSGQFLSVPLGPVPASAGLFRGTVVTGLNTPPLVLDSSNNQFTINVDGTSSGNITLAEGSYASAQALVAEIQAKIDADVALDATGAAVTVSFNTATNALELTSATKGVKSKVDVVAVGAGVPATLGIAVGIGVPGKSASTVADQAGGLQIQIVGGALGARGDVTLIRGVMSQFNRYLGETLSFTGSLQNRVSTLQSELGEIEKEGKDFDSRMESLENRLRTQFASADALISKLNSTSSFLDSQLASLPGYTAKQ